MSQCAVIHLFSVDIPTPKSEAPCSTLPAHIEASIDNFEQGITDDEYRDPAYRGRVAFVPIVKSRKSAADSAFKVVKRDTEMAQDLNKVSLKEVDRARYTATMVVNHIQGLGFTRFKMHDHTNLWQSLDAKNPNLKYGRAGDYSSSWVWHENWVERVRAHCEEKDDQYCP